MKKVRARFNCSSVQDVNGNKQASLSAIAGEEKDNKDISTGTPSGNLQIQVDADTPAVDFFEAGQDYYLDFSKVK